MAVPVVAEQVTLTRPPLKLLPFVLACYWLVRDRRMFARAQFTAAMLLGDFMLVGLGIRLALMLWRGADSRRPDVALWEWSFITATILVISLSSAMDYIALILGACSYAVVRVAAASPRSDRRGPCGIFGPPWCSSGSSGSASAQYAVRRAYARGVGAVQDDGRAAMWLRRAADQNLPEAEFDLATLYLWGCGAPRDRSEFIGWTRRAAEHGLARAERRLGAANAAGVGVEPSDATALQWYQTAASAGDSAAQTLTSDAAARRVDIPITFDSRDLFLEAAASCRAARNGSGYRLLTAAAGLWVREQFAALVGSSRCLDPRR